MLDHLNKKSRQQQTLSSFDFQWRNLPEGDAMLSDPWFNRHVSDILQEITGVSSAWFQGKRVLDAGCGSGRWSAGLLRLGAQVTAMDFSEAGLERTRSVCAGLGSLETFRVNLLDIPEELLVRRFDMVYSFGVLHHTGRTFEALRNVASLVAEDGLMFLYLYGSDSWGMKQKLNINWARLRLSGLSFDQKIERLRQMYPDHDPHQCFDLLSPVINDRLSFDSVRRELEMLGFVDSKQTIRSGEIYLRAQRPGFLDVESLIPGPLEKSFFISHYEEVNRIRRDKIYERTFCDMAARVIKESGKEAAVSLEHICKRLAIPPQSLKGRKILVICHDSVAPSLDLLESDVCVTYMTPSELRAGQVDSKVRVIVGSMLDEPLSDDEPYDFILALGSSVSISRRPELAIERLTSRLAPGGTLVIETLLPDQETVIHKMRRLILKPVPFEKKVEILLRRNIKTGLAGTFSLISSRLPLRMSLPDIRKSLQRAGLREIACSVDGADLLVSAEACNGKSD